MAAFATTIHNIAASEAIESCPYGVFEDLTDVFLLVGIFCAGWMITRFSTRRLGLQKYRSMKGGDWMPSAARKHQEADDDEIGRCTGSPKESVDSARAAKDAWRAAEEETERWVEAAQPGNPLDDLLSLLYSDEDMCGGCAEDFGADEVVAEEPQEPMPLREEVAGVDVVTNTTLSVLVRRCAARGELREALVLFRELPLLHGFQADAQPHHAMVSACLAAGQHETAAEVFWAMTAFGVVPTAKTYEALARAALHRGDLAEAAEILRHTCGAPPSTEPEAPATRHRAWLERQLIEDLLTLIGRRRQASALGVPLLHALQAAGVEVSETLAASMLKVAAAETAASAKAPSAAVERGRRADALVAWRSVLGTAAA